ncbi:MAG: hypothetical protein ACPLKS_07670, partial [Caldisericum exile]|uniref:hypothetical protein n=1 Tax=Caldisericum exile TaxID=693075 RepID=UPI003C70EF16
HEKLESYFKDILDAFFRGDDIHPSYLITGVFGQGKTTFLYHILRESIEKGILPIFVIARDISEKIETRDYGEVRKRINEITEKLKSDFQKGDFIQYGQYIMSLPERSQKELIEFYQRNLDKISHSDKVILLIDELEDVYKKIKEKAGSDPLRTWLEDKSYLKILSLTPSGIYDLGGADESRLIKWNIPPVSIEYVRKNIELSTGKANALWWLSRGVPRHIIQNLGKLKEISEEDGSYKISETLKSLERIGKEPGRVNAVEIGSLSDHSKIKYLINLIPQESQPYRGFFITKELDEGVVSNVFQRIFNLTREEEKDLALTMAHYFKHIAMAISDENFTAYVDGNEINEFMELASDILLENEYKKPVVEENIAKLLGIYEKLRSNPSLLLTTIITNPSGGISFKEVDKKLPFTINEIRKLFPFPMANPIIKSNPDDVFREVEGGGKPVCKNDAFMFFASYRDFEKYLATDEFKNAILPEGKHFAILLSEDDFDRYENVVRNPTSKSEQVLKWLIDNSKLGVVKSPPSIKIFLLSLYGYENRIPYNIDSIAENIKMSKESLLKKKFELYYTALNELVKDNKTTPKYFFERKPEPKGLSDVWGVTQLSEEDVALAGLALSFYNLSPNDRANLISLRELFRTKERRGDLADIKVAKGLPTLADDLLPRKNRRGMIINATSVEDLKDFWSKDEREKLERLSRLLELSEFNKLSSDVNHERILEAFWRATRDEFDIDGINEFKRRLEDAIEKLQFIQEVEKKSKDNSKLGLIFEELQENVVKALDGLKKLVGLSFESKLPNFILKLYLEATLDKIENLVIDLYNHIQRVNEKLENLNKRVDGIINYLSGKKEILDFISDKVSFEDIKQELKNLTVINNDLNLSDAEREIGDRLSSADTIFTKIGELENKLGELKQKLSEHNLLEVR